MSKSNHLPIFYIEWISSPRWEKQTRSNCIMFETWDEHIGIFSVFIHTTYYPHAVLTQARIITMQQYDNNAPEPKHAIDHPNASLDSICFPLTSFFISPFTLPSHISPFCLCFVIWAQRIMRQLMPPHTPICFPPFLSHTSSPFYSPLLFFSLTDLPIPYLHSIPSILRFDQLWAPQMPLSCCFPQIHSLWPFSTQ